MTLDQEEALTKLESWLIPVFSSNVATLVMWRKLRFFLQTGCRAVLEAT
jgi:hypothetical protein